MRTISLMVCLLAVVVTGCSRTFNGYRGTPQTPAEILHLGPHLDKADYPGMKQTATPSGHVLKGLSNSDTLTKPDIRPKTVRAGEIFDDEDDPAPERVAVPSDPVQAMFSNPGTSIEALNVPVSTALPLQPTEYRRVWIAPHLNRFGDAIHGHYCEIVYREAAFKAPALSRVPPSAPVLVKKGAVHKPPIVRASPSPTSGAVVTPNLQDYLQQLGIAQHGR